MEAIAFLAHNDRVIPDLVEPMGEYVGRPRSFVQGFSKFSRQRLTDLLYSYKKSPFKSFWTFTFDKDVKPEFAKKEINRLNMIFNRRGIGWMWVMEFTKNGRIHFHYGLTEFLSQKWVTKMWRNGHVSANIIISEEGLRHYFLKEISKTNQKSPHGLAGRWWGVCRPLNKKISLGVYDVSFLHALVSIVGFKRTYYRDDLEGILDNPYSDCDNFSEVKTQFLKCLHREVQQLKGERKTYA